MIDIEQTRTAIAEAAQSASLGIISFASTHRAELAACTPNTRDNLIIRAALAYLFSQGLIKAVENDQEWLTLGIPEPFDGDLTAALHDGVEEQRRLNAAMFG